MVGLFYIYLPMSWQIPTQIEQDIIAGKAKYQTFQTGNGGQSMLPVPPNSYVVIFGYDFSPAGGGLKELVEQSFTAGAGSVIINSSRIRFFETQQISFYTGTDFYPFIHHCDVKTSLAPLVIQNNIPPAVNIVTSYQICEEIDNTPISRQVYITSTNDVAITVGLILQMNDEVAGPIQEAIPITNTTPQALTYGGSGQVVNIQTQYSAAGFSPVFTQPSVKDYDKYQFVAPLPGNPDNQVFATPDVVNGLRDPSQYLNSLGAPFNRAAATQYYLCMHYAIYSAAIPETRG
jgi:hypothetical protein